jgi:hypothetical protein
VRLYYFASKADRRGSVTQYAERKLISKILKWFDQPQNDPGQVLITANRQFEHLFEKPKVVSHLIATTDGVATVTETTMIPRIYAPPRLAGTDIFKDMSNVAFLAAMRPGGDETEFVARSLLIDEEDIIRWREYNVLYQFIMRVCLRKFESSEVANVYVFDEFQAEYLRDRFGGCVSYEQIKGFSEPAIAGGRPKTGAKNSAERKRAQRARDRTEMSTAKAAKLEADKAAKVAVSKLSKLEQLHILMQKSRKGG